MEIQRTHLMGVVDHFCALQSVGEADDTLLRQCWRKGKQERKWNKGQDDCFLKVNNKFRTEKLTLGKIR